MRNINLYDSLACLNCAACMSACSMENRMRMERDDNIDLTRAVNEFNYGSYYLRPERLEVGNYPDARTLVAFAHCRHCEVAACMDNCPTHAIERRPQGQVVINESACVGCRTCQDVCPFDVPFYDAQTGLARKCTGCYDRVESGLDPACVSACMAGALISGPEDEVIQEANSRVAQYSKRLGKEYVVYGKDKVNSGVGRLGWLTIAAREDADFYLMPDNPSKPAMQTRSAVRAACGIGAAGVVAGAAIHGIYLLSARKEKIKSEEGQNNEVPHD